MGYFDQFDDFVADLDGGGPAIMPEYQDDPVGFGQQELGHDYPDDIKAVMHSVLECEVTVAKSANGVGKSFSAADIAIWFHKAFPNSQVFTAAAPPESNLKNILWGSIGTIVEDHPELLQGKIQGLRIERKKEEFITGLTIPTQGTAHTREAKFSGKHAPHILFIVDEGDAVPDECYKGIESCMSGGFARLLVMFNPRFKQGAVYRMIRDRQANVIQLNAFNHPNVISGKDVFPGAVTRQKVGWRVHHWCRHVNYEERIVNNPEYFELPECLVGFQPEEKDGRLLPPLKAGYYKVIEPEFYYMVLGEYPATDIYRLIPESDVLAARARWDEHVRRHGGKEIPPAGFHGIGGLDPAELGPDDSVLCKRYGGFVKTFDSWGGVDVIITGDRGHDLAGEHALTAVCVDGNGVGAGVAPHMRRLGTKSFAFKTQQRPDTGQTTEQGEFALLRDQLAWAVREWLRTDPGAMLPPDDELGEELLCATYETRKTDRKIKVIGKHKMKDLLKRSPGKFDSLCLTFAKIPSVEGGMTSARHNAMKAKYCQPVIGVDPHLQIMQQLRGTAWHH